MERAFYGRDGCNEKKTKKISKKQKLAGSSPHTLQLRSSLAGPGMALRPGRRTSPSARPSPNRKILPFRKCTPQQPLQITKRLRSDSWHAVTNVYRVVPRVIDTGKGE